MGKLATLLVAGILLTATASAHEHHTVEEIDFGEPIDTIIWLHMVLQTAVWGVLFPVGMVLGLSKSRWHVPLQSTCLVLTTAGIIMGHHHKGREFPATFHGTMAKIITAMMIIQATLGIYLKSHLHPLTLRPYAVRAHKIVGVLYPIVGWVQILLGVVTALGYCGGGGLGQCLAHYIMGSAFIAYGAIMLLMLFLGQDLLRRKGQSMEWYDSWVIMIWGIVNTFTEHHDAWNKNWSHKDMQHTMMGVLWWTGGALGIFLSRGGKRSFVPAVIILMTGWGMSAHEQELMISTKIHGLFGYALMAAGLARIIEICFVLGDVASEGAVRIFQYLPPYLLVVGGTMFMGGTDEELRHADDIGIDHVSYALFIFSISFLLFLHIVFLINLYTSSGQNSSPTSHPLAKEEGYHLANADDGGGPESFELAEQDPTESGTMYDQGHDGELDGDAKEFVIGEDDWGKGGGEGYQQGR